MDPGVFRFERFTLDCGERQLRRGGEPVELNSRYLDALALLVREDGRLVSKDRFLDEVWKGVPVTDEALTQCIRTLRKQLGDDAARPRFIETVPKHGYRFIAAVEGGSSRTFEPIGRRPAWTWGRLPIDAAAGVAGGGVAGLLGGLFYGFAAAGEPLGPGTGATSVLLVLLAITVAVALIGAAGVSLGIAAAGMASRRFGPWTIAGGAIGGMVVGAFVKLLGLDAFELLFGRSPGDITGAGEGALLGAAVGAGAWLAMRRQPLSVRGAMLAAAACGALAGVVASLAGGRLMGGSLDLLARSFPQSRLRLDQLGALFGESGFGTVSQTAMAGLEGALFAGCVVGAMVLAEQKLHRGGGSDVEHQPHPLPAEG